MRECFMWSDMSRLLMWRNFASCERQDVALTPRFFAFLTTDDLAFNLDLCRPFGFFSASCIRGNGLEFSWRASPWGYCSFFRGAANFLCLSGGNKCAKR